MAISIDQKPGGNILPIGQQVMFAVSENTIVATMFNVKFIAEVYVSNTSITWSASDLIGTFKTTPNNAGVGIFDLRPILETFVSPDYEPNSTTFPASTSEYKGTNATEVMFPIHIIDKYSVSVNSIKYFSVRFRVEYSETATGNIISPGDPTDSGMDLMFNGVLQYDDVLSLNYGDYRFNLDNPTLARHFYLYYPPSNFLSNAPTTQYARATDYGTFPLFNFLPQPTAAYRVHSILITAYNQSGVAYMSQSITNSAANGGTQSYTTDSYNNLQYIGIFPANIRQHNALWETDLAAGLIKYYTVEARNDSAAVVSDTYTINIICPNERGYEGIRLTWLNQWGTWDYYTFNMKSTRSISTNRTSYTQQGGTWNESTFKIKGYKGGKKNFRVNSTEKIKLNTDFVTEEEGVWFEELINSPEVYIVNGFSADASNTITNKYIEPVVLTTSSYIKKTIANDKVMQYTIEIEKSKMKRTQSV